LALLNAWQKPMQSPILSAF